MIRQYFVNATTRLCQILGGRGPEHKLNVSKALSSGFVEVTGEELDAFRAETKLAIDAGWKPAGRKSYAKFIEQQRVAE